MLIPPSIRKPIGRLIPILLYQSTQTRCPHKSHRTNRALTGKCGSLPCQRPKITHGLSTWSGNSFTTMPTRSACLQTTHFQWRLRSLSVRRSTGMSSRSRTIPTTSGGRANCLEAGCRHYRPTILGCVAFCSKLGGSLKRRPCNWSSVTRRWIDLAPTMRSIGIAMSKFVPLISSGIAGPLGVLHLPRLWLKVSLDARGKLADGYPAVGTGFDQMVLDGLNLKRDAVVSFISEKRPTYPQFEQWVRQQPGATLDQASIEKLNRAIAGYNH